MALITCPECGKQISDKAASCPGCGCPASEFAGFEETEKEDAICPFCGEELVIEDGYCAVCGMRITSYMEEKDKTYGREEVEQIEEFNGVYRHTLFKGLQRVYCPRCGSQNCSHYYEQRIIPGMTKTQYSANLNPLRPFTLVNKKEKVVRQERIATDHKFMCNECGKLFL